MKTAWITFADLVIQGTPAGRAYEQAGYRARGNAAEVNGSRLLKNAQVQAYMSKMREKVANRTALTLAKTHDLLERIALKNIDTDPRVTIQALDQANRLRGDYSDKLQVKVESTSLAALIKNKRSR
jgi:phage terminase small subunit